MMKRDKCYTLKCLFLTLIAILSSEALAGLNSLHYQAPFGDERWRASTSRLRCGLSLKVKDFGTAYFEQYSAKSPHFIMTYWQKVRATRRAEIYAVSPQWKPHGGVKLLASAVIKPGKYAVVAREKTTREILAALYRGYKTRLKYHSTMGDTVRVDLSPVNFQKAYSRYIRCVGALLPFDYQQVAETTLYFSNEHRELNQADKRLLDRVRTYVAVDPKVRQVFIAGFTDNSGRRSYNNAISEQRAKAVGAYLLRKGVPKRKMKVTWYGEKKAIASNDSEQGRAKNRRVVIRIIK